MTMLWNEQSTAKATDGKGQGQWQAESVSIDSRNIVPGTLFVALKGEHFDGHDYVKEALAKGAAAAVVSHIPEGVSESANLLVVKDTYQALIDLGLAARARTRAKIVAITGSVGKTSTKETLRTLLAACGSVYATTGNLNNHIGVPLSLANLPQSTDYAVIELGMNHPGEIAQLTRWVRPDVSLISNVEAVHLEFFDSVEAIADAKAEIFQGMNRGTAILNADSGHYVRLRAAAKKQDVGRAITFGEAELADCRLLEYRSSLTGSEVLADIRGTTLRYRIGAVGRHWAMITLSALAIVEALGADLAKAAAACAQVREPKGRGRLQLVAVNGVQVTLVDDSYNASPTSMNAAFAKMRELKQSIAPPPRTLAVLGDMLELGEASVRMHVGLVPSLVNNQIDLVFAAGKFMKHLYDALPEPMKGAYSPDAASLAPSVKNAVRPRDIVLVKGSHGSKMHTIIPMLVDSNTEGEL